MGKIPGQAGDGTVESDRRIRGEESPRMRQCMMNPDPHFRHPRVLLSGIYSRPHPVCFGRSGLSLLLNDQRHGAGFEAGDDVEGACPGGVV